MKMFTNNVQTAKLIELGFKKPKNERWVLDVVNECTPSIQNIVKRQDYSIGELIEMLPENIAKQDEMPSTLNISLMNGEWCVQYADFLGTDFEFCNTELIDALCNMVVRLKEKEVI